MQQHTSPKKLKKLGTSPLAEHASVQCDYWAIPPSSILRKLGTQEGSRFIKGRWQLLPQ